MTRLGRRALLAGIGAGTAALATGLAEARIRPGDLKPLIGPGHKPTEADEIGLWQQMQRVEEEVAGSNLLIKDPALNAYLKQLISKSTALELAHDPNEFKRLARIP